MSRCLDSIHLNKELSNDLFYFFTAALDSFIGVDASRDGGEFLLFLTQAHLRVHAVDEALHYCHLVEGEYKRHLSRHVAEQVPTRLNNF